MSNVTIHDGDATLVKQHEADLAPLVEALDASSTDICVVCGTALGGILGSFTWDIVHGQGYCAGGPFSDDCGFPYVYYHYYEVYPARHPPMTNPRPGKELLLMAFVPNADIPENS